MPSPEAGQPGVTSQSTWGQACWPIWGETALSVLHKIRNITTPGDGGTYPAYGVLRRSWNGFFRHERVYHPMHKKGVQRLPDYTPYSSFDEPSSGYPSSGCSPAEPLSVSPNSYALLQHFNCLLKNLIWQVIESFLCSQLHTCHDGSMCFTGNTS